LGKQFFPLGLIRPDKRLTQALSMPQQERFLRFSLPKGSKARFNCSAIRLTHKPAKILKLAPTAFVIADSPPQMQSFQHLRRERQSLPPARRKTRQFFRQLLQSGAFAFALRTAYPAVVIALLVFPLRGHVRRFTRI
jgi:hypothetical protein